MDDLTRRPAVINLNPASSKSSASLALTTPAVLNLQPALARSRATVELSVGQPQSVVLEHSIVRAGTRNVRGEVVTRPGTRRLDSRQELERLAQVLTVLMAGAALGKDTEDPHAAGGMLLALLLVVYVLGRR